MVEKVQRLALQSILQQPVAAPEKAFSCVKTLLLSCLSSLPPILDIICEQSLQYSVFGQGLGMSFGVVTLGMSG